MNKQCLLFNTFLQHIFATGTRCHCSLVGERFVTLPQARSFHCEGEQKVGLPSTRGDHRGGVDTHAHCPFSRMVPGLGGQSIPCAVGTRGAHQDPSALHEAPSAAPSGCYHMGVPPLQLASSRFSAVKSCHEAANTWRNTAP